MPVVNVAISDTFILRDNSNVAITGKVSADFATTEAYQIIAPGTTSTITITEIGSGKYRINFTPTTADRWGAHVIYNAGGVFREFTETYDVLSAAADPAAIADAIAGIMDQSSTGYDAGTIGYEIHALFKRPVGSG